MLRCIFSNDSEIVCVLHMYIIRKEGRAVGKKNIRTTVGRRPSYRPYAQVFFILLFSGRDSVKHLQQGY